MLVFTTLFAALAPTWRALIQRPGAWLRRSALHMRQELIADWHGARYVPLALLLLVITSAATASFYVGQPPQPEFSYDTPSYLHVTQQILASGNPIDPLRTPGYPLLVALIFLLAGVGNFGAVALVQGALFVLATMEIFALTALLFRRPWVALVVGLLVGTNTFLLSFVKPMIVEGFALWLTASLALAVVLYIKTLRAGYLWLATGFLLILLLTRPEWIYLPIPFFAYLLLIAWRHGKLRRLLPHGLAAVVLVNAVLGLCISVNAAQNGYGGFSYVERINLVGKVLQYHMENEAPPQYAAVAQHVSAFAAQGGWNPYELATEYPAIAAQQWSLGGAYASAIVAQHPVQFLVDSVVVFFTSSDQYRAFSTLDANGPVAAPPLKLQVSLSAYVAQTYRFFPLVALLWIVLLFWRRTTRLASVEAMGGVVLLALYELILTSVGGYSDYDYARIHIPFDPLLIVVIWGTLLASLPLWEEVIAWLGLTRRTIWWVWGALIVLGGIGSILLALLTAGVRGALHPSTWLVVRVVLSHPPRLLTVLALAVLLTFLSYRVSRRASMAPDKPKKPADVEVQV